MHQRITQTLALALLLAVPEGMAVERVALRLDQPTKTECREAPISGGLPFAKGRLGAIENLRLLDAVGRETPV